MKPERACVDGSRTRRGKVFHRLTAIRCIGKNRDRCEVWEFRCECGSTVAMAYTRVANGYAKSCGCQRSISAKRQAVAMIGQRFGRLVVIRRDGSNEHRAAMWECRCNCGNMLVTVGTSLRKGVVNSCGCLKTEILVRASKSRILTAGERERSASRRRENARVRMKRRRDTDPTYRLAKNISAMLRFALRRIGERKSESTFKMLPYTMEQLRTHLEKQFTRGMSWGNVGQWEIDHIVPLCTASTRDDVIRLNQLSNLRPLWAKDNHVKNGRMTLLC